MPTPPSGTPARSDVLAAYEASSYHNAGNESVLAKIPTNARRVLDVGCGTGTNARRLAARGHQVWGVTASASEATEARRYCEDVTVCDAEEGPPVSLPGPFDVVLFCHVLEHFRFPTKTLAAFTKIMAPEASVVIAVPNMAFWRLRIQFLKGDWMRTPDGPMDRTHLQFFSHQSIREVVTSAGLTVVEHSGEYSAPIRPIRRLSERLAHTVDDAIGRRFPNLFAQQTIVVARL